MDKREQRVRRDRRRDGRHTNTQKEQKIESKTQVVNAEAKKNDNKPSDKSADTTATKELAEDDPLRFANLKRETDEIAALKAKKPLKRQIFSNWAKFEQALPDLNDSQAVDFETLLRAPQSGNYFKFKSEKQWDDGASFGQYSALFSPDADLLVAGLNSLPFYTRLGLDRALFTEEQIQDMDSIAKANATDYEKWKKSKVKQKKPEVDFSKIEQAGSYETGETDGNPPAEERPALTVAAPEETVPSHGKSPSPAAPGTPAGDFRSREATPAISELPAHGLTFSRPPPAEVVRGSSRSPLASRETTPVPGSQYREETPPPSRAEMPVLAEKTPVETCNAVEKVSVVQLEPTTPPEQKAPSLSSPVEPAVQVEVNSEEVTLPTQRDLPDQTLVKEGPTQNETKRGGKKQDDSRKGKQGKKKKEQTAEKQRVVASGEDVKVKEADKRPRKISDETREKPTTADPETAPAVGAREPEPPAGDPRETGVREPERPVSREVEERREMPPRAAAAQADKSVSAKEAAVPVLGKKKRDDDHLDFLQSLKGQKAAGTVSEVEVARAAVAAVPAARSAIEEDELQESQKPKPPPLIVSEKKEDLEDWLDSMLDD